MKVTINLRAFMTAHDFVVNRKSQKVMIVVIRSMVKEKDHNCPFYEVTM